MATNQTNNVQSFLSFRLGNEVFAISVFKVLNILEMSPITKVPQAPDFIKGVINLRGNVLPVIDLRIKFGMEPVEKTIDTCIIVLDIKVDNDQTLVGIQVDAVKEVLALSDSQIEPPPTIGTKYSNVFIQGMYRVDESFIMILNIDKLFETNEIIDVNQITKDIAVEESQNK
ncbi:MAG: chemotaxis protein CheW [Candidatus Methanofastidiosa archaeon]|nr:chemotaxis protein CheW [Candidatus Methanofastidiosa archaeon]